jgi:hypothetical protein
MVGRQVLDIHFHAGKVPEAALNWRTYAVAPYFLDEASAKALTARMRKERVFVSSSHQVWVRDDAPRSNPWGIWAHVRLERRDRRPLSMRWEMNAIKEAVVGQAFEAYELLPAESRRTDSDNQCHFFVGKSELSMASSWRPLLVQHRANLRGWDVEVESVDDRGGLVVALARVKWGTPGEYREPAWSDLQSIKNEIAGRETEGVSVLRGFATADPGYGMSDIWVVKKGRHAPLGWHERFILDAKEAVLLGDVQGSSG